MAGIKNLDELMKEMMPVLFDTEYVFCCVPEQLDILRLNPLLTFREKEGTTIIIEKTTADTNKIAYSGIWKLITLSVHSDLSAVGFLAKITSSLTKAGISVDVVSAFYHDHLFVPAEKAEKAMTILAKLSGL